ncbi:MAG: winged-helix domain-containing protein [Eubacterium sp.]|nr:winged-helix domain-containing protein [Eubacterium sp.]
MGKILFIADENKQTCDFISLAAESAGYTVIRAYGSADIKAVGRVPDIAVFSAEYSELADSVKPLWDGCRIYFLKDGGTGSNVLSLPIQPAQLADMLSSSELPEDMALDETTARLSVSGKEIALTLNEQELLKYLVLNPNRAFSNEELALEVFGADVNDVQALAGDTAASLARKLEGSSEIWALKHLWGVGYKFEIMI